MSGGFVTEQGTGEYRASKFVGLDIYGPENQKIGDINEVLIDGSGNAKAVVIGIGGFLGIGEKSVAVPFSAITWHNDRVTSTSSTAPAAVPATGMTGTTTTAAPARSSAETAAYNGYPDHGSIKMTRAELQAAPAFKYFADTHSSSGAPTNAMPPASTTPRK